MDAFSGTDYVVYALVDLVVSIFSGIAGAGGGFIMTPLLIFLGLSPAQAVATGKFAGLSLSISSLHGFKGAERTPKKQLYFIMGMALVIGLIAPIAITKLDSDVYERLLGILILSMIPIVIYKKVGYSKTEVSRRYKKIGYLLLAFTLGLQAVFSGGLGTLVNVVVMSFLGMSALGANITKRYSQVVLNTAVIVGVAFAHIIIWPVALIGIIFSALGGHIGAKIALKKGDKFIMDIFIIFMLISAIALIV